MATSLSFSSVAFATASQGVLAASAVQPSGSTAQYIRGDGSLVSIPAIGVQMVADTGWTAAAATASKTITLSTWTAGGITGTIVTGANALVGLSGLGTVLGNMDTQLAALTARLAQLETTLSTGKLPNA